MNPISVEQHIAGLVKAHGSYRAVAKATGVHFTWVYKLAKGGQHWPSKETLEKLGLHPEAYFYPTCRS